MTIAYALITRTGSCCCLYVLTCPYSLVFSSRQAPNCFPNKTIKRFNLSLFVYGTAVSDSNYSPAGGNSNIASLGGTCCQHKLWSKFLFTATEHNIHNTCEIITGQSIKIRTCLLMLNSSSNFNNSYTIEFIIIIFQPRQIFNSLLSREQCGSESQLTTQNVAVFTLFTQMKLPLDPFEYDKKVRTRYLNKVHHLTIVVINYERSFTLNSTV